MDSPTVLFCRWADCSLYFVDSEVLLLHCMNDHVGRKITNNLCLDCHWGDCDVKTSKRDHITSHLRVHIPHKPYVCSNCSKTFKRPQDLKKHEKLHGEPEELQPQSHLHSNPNSHPNTTAFVPDYLSVYSGDNSFPSRRELSPQSTSSDVLATTPPSGLPFNPHPQYNQFLNGIYNKQLTPDYNENMANMLRAMSSSNPQELAASINPDMDINGFNHFMNQLHGNVVPEAPPLFNENVNSMPPSFVDPNFNFNNNGSTPCLPSDNFAYVNQMNYNQGYGYDQNQAPAFNTMQMNCGMTPQQLQQQQLQQQQQQQQLHQQQQQQHSAPFPNQSQAPMTAYPSLDFDSNLSTYQQANGLYQGMMDPKLQVSHDGTGFMAPQVDYSNGHQYLSIAVTPQRSEPRLMKDKSDKLSTTSSPDAPATEEDKETKKPAPPVTDASSGDKKSEQSGTEESTSAGLDALATQLGSLDLSPSSSKVSLSHSDSDSDSSSSDKGRLQDAALIRSLVLQVNKLFRNLHPSPSTTTTKSSTTNTASPTTSLPPKDIFPTYSPTIVECSQYPSLDDL